MLEITPANIESFLEGVDPLTEGSQSFGTIGDIISRLLLYIYPLVGLVLFGMLIMGGFDLLTSGGNPETIKKGQGKITSALIGFLIVFLSYWLIQIIQVILGLGTIF